MAINFGADNLTLATGGWDAVAILWDVRRGRMKMRLVGHRGHITDIVINPECTLVATASRDFSAILWDAVTGERCTVLTGHLSTVNRVAFSSDGLLLATGSGDCSVKLWDVADSKAQLSSTREVTGRVLALAFQGHHLAVGCNVSSAEETCLYVWDLQHDCSCSDPKGTPRKRRSQDEGLLKYSQKGTARANCGICGVWGRVFAPKSPELSTT